METEECSKLEEKILFIIKYTYTMTSWHNYLYFFNVPAFCCGCQQPPLGSSLNYVQIKFKILHLLCQHLKTQSFLILLVDSLSKLPLFTSTVSDPMNS
jgi:hypothetical protein